MYTMPENFILPGKDRKWKNKNFNYFKRIHLQCVVVFEYHTSLVNCKLNVVSRRSPLMAPKFVEKTLEVITFL